MFYAGLSLFVCLHRCTHATAEGPRRTHRFGLFVCVAYYENVIRSKGRAGPGPTPRSFYLHDKVLL